MSANGIFNYVADGQVIPDSFARKYPEEFAFLDWKPGHIGKLSLEPTAGVEKRIVDFKKYRENYKQVRLFQERQESKKKRELKTLRPGSFDYSPARAANFSGWEDQKFFKATHLDSEWIEDTRREAAWRRRLGIVGNNLAVPDKDLLKRCNTSGYDSEKIGRKKDFEIQRTIKKYNLAYKNVHTCGNWCHSQVVEIKQHNKHKSCNTTGVKTCGSVWCCPVCRRKILNRRSETLKKMAEFWTKKRGGRLAMLTFTVPHNRSESLAEIYGSSTRGRGLAGALSNFRAKRAFARDFKNRIGYAGDVRTVEVTHGKNGWHCHVHMLLFFEKKIDLDYWETRLGESWKKSCLKCGLREPNKHGFDIEPIGSREAGDFSGYMAKWGAPSEVTSQHAKGAKNGNMTVAELEQCLVDDFSRSWNGLNLKEVCRILSIYYNTMKGQKMLQTGGISEAENWRADLIEEMEKTDAEMLDLDQEEHSKPVAQITAAAYHKIARRGLVWRLLDHAEKGGLGGIYDFFEEQKISLHHLRRPGDWHLKKILARIGGGMIPVKKRQKYTKPPD